MSSRDKYQSIPDPSVSSTALLDAVSALKESVEVMAGQRQPRASGKVSWNDLIDLGLITPDQVPRDRTAF